MFKLLGFYIYICLFIMFLYFIYLTDNVVSN